MDIIEIQVFGLISAKASGVLGIAALVLVIVALLGYRLGLKRLKR